MATKTCPRCGGSGYLWLTGVRKGSQNNAPLCNRCNGTGSIYVPDKSSSSGGVGGGGCFVTTATLTSIGKSDDCIELQVFRNFRDNWLSEQKGGQQLILEYYEIAPKIVSAINSLPLSERMKVYKRIWKDGIQPCLMLIQNKRYSDAKAIYEKIILGLKEIYLPSN